jgi:hypothetical protein
MAKFNFMLTPSALTHPLAISAINNLKKKLEGAKLLRELLHPKPFIYTLAAKVCFKL